LSLVECQEFTDVSILGKLEELNLSDTLINDVSMLGNVEELDISGLLIEKEVINKLRRTVKRLIT